MSRRFPFSKSFLTAAAAAALALGGCTSDDLGDSVRPSAADEKAGKDSSGRFAALMRVAASTAAAGDLATAASLYRRAHELEPFRVDALVALGRTFASLGAHDKAAKAFRSAIDAAYLSTDNKIQAAPEAAHGLGNALVAMDQPKAAITQYEHAITVRDAARTYNGIGVAYDMLGQHQAAQAYYRTGLEVDPGDLGLMNNLGLSLAVVGRHDEAIVVLRKAAHSPKAGPRQRLNLALAYGLAGRTRDAAQVASGELDDAAVRNNLVYYATLRAMKDKRSVLRAIGTHTAGFHLDPDRPDIAARRAARTRGRRSN